MQISVRFFTSLREIVDRKEDILEFSETENVTIEKILTILSHRHGKRFVEYVFNNETEEVKSFLQFLVNGKSTSNLEGLRTKLEDGDVLAILPPVGGG